MHAKSIISVKEFCEKYGVTNNRIYVFLSKNPKYKVTEIDNFTGRKIVKIDEKHLLDLQEKKIRLWHYCTNVYYELIDKYGNDNNLSEELAKFGDFKKNDWYIFLRDGLFTLPGDDILKIYISDKQILLLKYAMILLNSKENNEDIISLLNSIEHDKKPKKNRKIKKRKVLEMVS